VLLDQPLWSMPDATTAPTPGPIDRLDALTIWPYPRRVLTVVGAAYFFAFSDVVNIGFALPVLEKQFGVSSGYAASAITAGLVGYVIGAIGDAAIGDRYGRRIGLTISILAFSLGTTVAALAPVFELVIVGRFIAGMGIGAEIASAAAYLAGIAPSRLRGRAGTLAVTWGFAGLAATPFLALALVPHLEIGWRLLFMISVVGGLATLPFRRHLPESPRWLMQRGNREDADRLVTAAETYAQSRGDSGTPMPPAPQVNSMPFRSAVVLFLGIWFIYYIGNYAWLTLTPTLLTKEGFSLTSSIGFLSITGIGLVVGAAASTRLAERWPRKATAASALVVFALSLGAIGLAPVAAVIMTLGFVVSMTIGMVVPIMYVLTAEHFNSDRRARGVALSDGLGHLGGAICPVVILPMAGIGFAWAMAAMAITGLLAAVLLRFTRNLTGQSIA